MIISYKGERSILVFHSFSPNDFEIPKNLQTQWLYVGPLGEDYRKLYAHITALAAEKNIKIALNPGAVQIHDGLSSFGGLLKVAKILFLNKEEGKQVVGLSGMASPKEIIKKLQETGVEVVCLTDGENGAYVARGEEFFKVGAYPARRIEATGAGDAFASAFLVGYIKDLDLYSCLKLGVTNSASVIESYGAQAGLLSLGTLKRRMKDYKWPAGTLRFS